MADDQATRERLLERLRRDCGRTVLDALANPRVAEVIRNADGKLWVDVAGEGLVDTGEVMATSNAESLLTVAATMLHTTLTRENPILEGELPLDGSRLLGVIWPIVESPVFAIRKKAAIVFGLDDYEARGMLLPGTHRESSGSGVDYWGGARSAIEALRGAITRHANILIVGGTGSGKTTLANALNAAIADLCPNDRVIALEDTRELQIPVRNHVLLRASEYVSMQRLLRATMRLRPDRIVVGEVRGGEAYTLLKAWNSGHPGGLATIHADSAVQGLQKLTDYVFEAPEAAASNQERMGRVIASAVQVVLFIERTSASPGRAVSEICRVRGFNSGSFELETLSIHHHKEFQDEVAVA